MKKTLPGLLLTAAFTAPTFATSDFGIKVEHLLKAQAFKYFGIIKPLAESVSDHTTRQTEQSASDVVNVATGLHAQFFTRESSAWADQIAFWPNRENATHLFTGVENFNPLTGSHGESQACVQRIDITTGKSEIVLRGPLGCDGIRVTPWGTIIVAEEKSDGALYEILDPLNVTEVVVSDRNTGANSNPTHIAKRQVQGLKSWEGIVVLPNGVLYSGDELRPGDQRDATGTRVSDSDGGTLYKFVPDIMHIDGTIDSLADSPLAHGSLYAMQVSCQEVSSSRFPQFGQGCEIGDATWIRIDSPENARAEADAKGATGYYRPEDFDIDPLFDNSEGVRFCVANTQREKAHGYGEVICVVDEYVNAHDELIDERTGYSYLAVGSNFATTTVTRFIEGGTKFNSLDNLAFQPHTGILYVVEDHKNGDVWACLPDGNDDNVQSDGCIRVLSIKDQSAEPTGFIFDETGTKAFVNIQHSDDTSMPQEVNGFTTDDMIEITGFKVHPGMLPAPTAGITP